MARVGITTEIARYREKISSQVARRAEDQQGRHFMFETVKQGAGNSSAHLPVKFGVRLSRKAASPSAKSFEPAERVRMTGISAKAALSPASR